MSSGRRRRANAGHDPARRAADPDHLRLLADGGGRSPAGGGDAGINTARTREEAYRHIRGYRPFVELPANHYPSSVTPEMGRLAALDVNARSGVMGAEVPLAPTTSGLAALSALSVKATIASPAGSSAASAKAIESLGDPMEIVLAARDLLREEGIRLKQGDLISLGTLTPPHAPVAGETFTVRYEIGGRSSEIRARFVP